MAIYMALGPLRYYTIKLLYHLYYLYFEYNCYDMEVGENRVRVFYGTEKREGE